MPTGWKFSLGTINIWRVEGEKIAEHWDLVDFAGLQKQLAAPPKLKAYALRWSATLSWTTRAK